MARSIRISNEDLYKELLRIQGEIQARTGEFTSMDSAIEEIVKAYRKASRK